VLIKFEESSEHRGSEVKEATINEDEETKTSWTHKIWIWPSLLYGYLTYMGMVLSWNRFNAFGINVFDFAELNDFLLAALRNPTLLALRLIAFPISVVYCFLFILRGFIGYINFQRRKRIPIKKSCLKIVSSLFSWQTIKKIFCAYPSWKNIKRILWFIKKMYAERMTRWLFWAAVLLPAMILPWWNPVVKVGLPDLNVEVLLKDAGGNNKQNSWIKDLVLIGTTEQYIFLNREKSREGVLIAPVSNVILIKESKPLICVSEVSIPRVA